MIEIIYYLYTNEFDDKNPILSKYDRTDKYGLVIEPTIPQKGMLVYIHDTALFNNDNYIVMDNLLIVVKEFKILENRYICEIRYVK